MQIHEDGYAVRHLMIVADIDQIHFYGIGFEFRKKRLDRALQALTKRYEISISLFNNDARARM
ncbi:hypothetical protein DRO03_06130 [Methanosarcinales archaeon]|nr:MAG: hypothetical protein DRO03_06130 [Methanosarcinales archaeon]